MEGAITKSDIDSLLLDLQSRDRELSEVSDSYRRLQFSLHMLVDRVQYLSARIARTTAS